MTKRNIKVYLKDKTAIIFSMMTQIIILGLYLLFLKQNYVDSMASMLDGFNIKTEDNLINALVNSWLVSGVIGTSVVTVAMNSLSVMISDKQNKIDYDYNASSVKGSTVVLSYFSGAVINTIVISAILLTAGIAFSCISGSSFPEFTELLKLYGLVILGSVSAVLILMFVASFFKKNSTYAAFNTLISVAIGFVIGAYIPVSQFSDGVQTFVNLIPGSHIAAMIRNVLVSPCINDISDLTRRSRPRNVCRRGRKSVCNQSQPFRKRSGFHIYDDVLNRCNRTFPCPQPYIIQIQFKTQGLIYDR